MSLIELLDQPLKGDALIELLNMHGAEVTYHFDRCRENIPDSYSTQIAALGLELIFDEHQKLETIFISVAEVDVIKSFDGEITPFASLGEAITFAERERFSFLQGRAELLGISRVWIRIQHPSHFAHYEYQPDLLAKITLTSRDIYATPSPP